MEAVHEKSGCRKLKPPVTTIAGLCPPLESVELHTCTLCIELKKAGAPLHQEMISETLASRILTESRNYVVVPSIGPLTAGHLLVVPRRHVFSILALPSDQRLECEGLIAVCAGRLRALYPDPVVVFEHGSAPHGSEDCGACVEHAHLHILPGPAEFVSRVRRCIEGWESGRTLNELAVGPYDRGYLLVGTVDVKPSFLIHRSPRSIPSQFLRRQYAALTEAIDSWDWRLQPRPDLFLRTIWDWKSV